LFFTFWMNAGNVLDLADAVQHAQHRLVRAAVERTVEPGHRSRERAERIRLRRADHPHGGRRAVLLVVRVQDEQDVQRALEHRVGAVLLHADPEQHVQEVAV
jgi:hypothetical protein